MQTFNGIPAEASSFPDRMVNVKATRPKGGCWHGGTTRTQLRVSIGFSFPNASSIYFQWFLETFVVYLFILWLGFMAPPTETMSDTERKLCSTIQSATQAPKAIYHAFLPEFHPSFISLLHSILIQPVDKVYTSSYSHFTVLYLRYTGLYRL